MTEYRIHGTGCVHACIVRADGGEDSKRLCRVDPKSEWRNAAFCAACNAREVPRCKRR